MTGKQSAVLWLGLLLIVVRLFTTNQWSSFKTTITTKSSTTTYPSQAPDAGATVPPDAGSNAIPIEGNAAPAEGSNTSPQAQDV
jgi:hypothetical protein